MDNLVFSSSEDKRALRCYLADSHVVGVHTPGRRRRARPAYQREEVAPGYGCTGCLEADRVIEAKGHFSNCLSRTSTLALFRSLGLGDILSSYDSVKR